VERRAGIGTTVTSREEDPVAICLSGDFRSWFDSVSGKSPKLTIDVLDTEITGCPENIAKTLRMPVNEDVWLMRRIRRFRGEAISYYMNYCSPEIFRDVDPKVFEKVSFLEVLQKQCANRISRVEQRVRAILADMDLADLLEVEFGVPLFFGEVVYCVGKDTPVEVTHFYFRGDRYIFFSAIPLKNKSK
jgi:Transcriptional regulators